MQSGYGGVSEIQQFMVESCGGPSLFSISPTNPSAATAPSPAPTDIHSAAAAASQPLKYHPLSHHHHPNLHHHPPSLPTPLPPHFSHFHSIPITQQLFQQPHHQFQLFHHHQPQQPAPHLEVRQQLILPHQLGLDQESGPENSASPTRMMGSGGGAGAGGPSFLAAPMSFKLAVNESSGGGSREGINDDDGVMHGDDGSESRLHHWQREDESAIKELSWRPLDIDYINRNNKRYKEKEPAIKYCKKSKEIAEEHHCHATAGSSNYKVFSELEAIYKPGSSTVGGEPNQTRSGSALTGEETPLMRAATTAAPGLQTSADHHVGGSTDTSAGEEAPAKKFSKSLARRKRKRRRQQQMNSVAPFFESLVKQLIDHQEGLHKNFLEVMERRDQERSNREEAWRKQEAAKVCQEAAARAHERALASSREAAIISFLEKITGQSLNLPAKAHLHSQFPVFDPNQEENNANADNLQIEPFSESLNFSDGDGTKVMFSTNRWPKTEVQALIRVRSGLESRFQEPGLKGPLWEEVSATMAAMGYNRSAKRCKEKWENINKYFRKTKESGKKRPQHSKTCPYFHQLDQLYSKSLSNKLTISSSSFNVNASVASVSTATGGAGKDQQKGNSELLDAILVSTEHQGRFDFKGNRDVNEARGSGAAAKEHPDLHGHVENNEEEDREDNAEDCGGRGGGDGGEGQGENQNHEGLNKQQYLELHQDQEDLTMQASACTRIPSKF